MKYIYNHAHVLWMQLNHFYFCYYLNYKLEEDHAFYYDIFMDFLMIFEEGRKRRSH